MPVTEFATLKLNSTYHDANGNITSSQFLEHLSRLSALQSGYSHYPLHFFISSTASSTSLNEVPQTRPEVRIYLLSKWDSVDAHKIWIASDSNQEMLRVLGQGECPFLDIVDMVHLDMDLDIARIRGEGSKSVSTSDLIVLVDRAANEGEALPRKEYKEGRGIERNIFVSFGATEIEQNGRHNGERIDMMELSIVAKV